jgi:hypothetical protein
VLSYRIIHSNTLLSFTSLNISSRTVLLDDFVFVIMIAADVYIRVIRVIIMPPSYRRRI